MVVDGFNDKDGVVPAKLIDEWFQLFIIGKSLYYRDDGLTGIIPIFPLADRLFIDEYISDRLVPQDIIDLDVKTITIC